MVLLASLHENTKSRVVLPLGLSMITPDWMQAGSLTAWSWLTWTDLTSGFTSPATTGWARRTAMDCTSETSSAAWIPWMCPKVRVFQKAQLSGALSERTGLLSHDFSHIKSNHVV